MLWVRTHLEATGKRMWIEMAIMDANLDQYPWLQEALQEKHVPWPLAEAPHPSLISWSFFVCHERSYGGVQCLGKRELNTGISF